MLTEKVAVVNGLSPKSGTNTDQTSDYVNSGKGNTITGLLSQITGGTNTGTYTVTVLAASDTSGTGAVAIPFRYRKKTTGASDVWGAPTQATASGFDTTANEDSLYEIEVDSQVVASNAAGKPFVAIKLTQKAADTLVTSLVLFVSQERYQSQTQPSVLS